MPARAEIQIQLSCQAGRLVAAQHHNMLFRLLRLCTSAFTVVLLIGLTIVRMKFLAGGLAVAGAAWITVGLPTSTSSQPTSHPSMSFALVIWMLVCVKALIHCRNNSIFYMHPSIRLVLAQVRALLMLFTFLSALVTTEAPFVIPAGILLLLLWSTDLHCLPSATAAAIGNVGVTGQPNNRNSSLAARNSRANPVIDEKLD
jgi:hypothetical protein